VSASGAGECSGFRSLLLPGLGNSPPYILALLPLPAGTGSAAPAVQHQVQRELRRAAAAAAGVLLRATSCGPQQAHSHPPA
jgi:hypothetical protein